jgi:hypothetical protein
MNYSKTYNGDKTKTFDFSKLNDTHKTHKKSSSLKKKKTTYKCKKKKNKDESYQDLFYYCIGGYNSCKK